MMAYREAVDRRNAHRVHTIFELIAKAAQDGGHDALNVVGSLARLGLGQQSTPEASQSVADAMAAVQPGPFGRPPDGIGHLVVTVSYEPIDRESVLESSHGFRVRKGPVMPMRQILRERTLQTLEGVLERIESMEAIGNSDNPPSSL